MPGRTLKLAGELQVGDVSEITAQRDHRPEQVTVVGIEPSVQIIRRPVVIVTYRRANGQTLHRQYVAGTTLKIYPRS